MHNLTKLETVSPETIEGKTIKYARYAADNSCTIMLIFTDDSYITISDPYGDSDVSINSSYVNIPEYDDLFVELGFITYEDTVRLKEEEEDRYIREQEERMKSAKLTLDKIDYDNYLKLKAKFENADKEE